ncbi:DUF3623 domain-containing protein [Sagittula sp. NFXS13]|uniref:putative photosynthetic complex assembly protein PuhE n=1 Tax=Sagittula sp. NFXS13 TaxID=2819095 RepID=UPI0032DFF2E4
MTSPWIAALAALFLWWFSTGAILIVVRRTEGAHFRARLGATLAGLPCLVLGIWTFEHTLSATTHASAYHAFLAALAIWGWIELSFLTGVITGPNLYPCPEDVPEWERFIRAWGTLAYHEMLLTTMLILLWLHGHDAENTFGLWTFTVLYLARVSAKLNLYLGVPRINVEFVPRALSHLSSHFRIQWMNWLFPLSVTGLTLAAGCWLERLYSAQTLQDITGFALLTSITALALLEHWFMVVPLPDAKLWRWMLPAPDQKTQKSRHPEEPHGI